MNQMKIYRVEQKNEEPVEVQIIRSSRRSMGLQVKADGTVCARVPMQVMDYAVQEFIEGHAEWIFKKRKLVLSKDNRPDIVYPDVYRRKGIALRICYGCQLWTNHYAESED